MAVALNTLPFVETIGCQTKLTSLAENWEKTGTPTETREVQTSARQTRTPTESKPGHPKGRGSRRRGHPPTAKRKGEPVKTGGCPRFARFAPFCVLENWWVSSLPSFLFQWVSRFWWVSSFVKTVGVQVLDWDGRRCADRPNHHLRIEAINSSRVLAFSRCFSARGEL